MTTSAYYNEIDPIAAAWLRNLIAAGLIAPGDVDERSIEDVRPTELAGYTQCHFFAGVGVWSLALRRAGWADGREVWTGSCPCQPFSAAGEGKGFADERHLWPAFHHLIKERRPAVVFGEQVASKDAGPWIDLVHDDMEALGYAFGAVPFPSAGVGAPHIRDRLYWVADAEGGGFRELWRALEPGVVRHADGGGDAPGGLGDHSSQGLSQRLGLSGVSGGPSGADQGQAAERAGVHAGGLADADRDGFGAQGRGAERADDERDAEPSGSAVGERAGPTNGLWRVADWLLCRDAKWRPVEGGTFPLAHGDPARVGRLRAYGNAINAEAARVFIESVAPERSQYLIDLETLDRIEGQRACFFDEMGEIAARRLEGSR